jgi:hypothetical protein
LQAHTKSDEGAQRTPNKDWTELDADKPRIEEWKIRRKTQTELAGTQRQRRHKEAADLYTLEPPAQPLQAHGGLTKTRSSLLRQSRTGAIGLRGFLFGRQVPGVPTPLCQCGRAPETVAHLVLKFSDPKLEDGRSQLRDRHALMKALGNRLDAARMVAWLLKVGRLQEYRLAVELEQEEAEEDPGEDRRDKKSGAPREKRT